MSLVLPILLGLGVGAAVVSTRSPTPSSDARQLPLPKEYGTAIAYISNPIAPVDYDLIDRIVAETRDAGHSREAAELEFAALKRRGNLLSGYDTIQKEANANPSLENRARLVELATALRGTGKVDEAAKIDAVRRQLANQYALRLPSRSNEQLTNEVRYLFLGNGAASWPEAWQSDLVSLQFELERRGLDELAQQINWALNERFRSTITPYRPGSQTPVAGTFSNPAEPYAFDFRDVLIPGYLFDHVSDQTTKDIITGWLTATALVTSGGLGPVVGAGAGAAAGSLLGPAVGSVVGPVVGTIITTGITTLADKMFAANGDFEKFLADWGGNVFTVAIRTVASVLGDKATAAAASQLANETIFVPLQRELSDPRLKAIIDRGIRELRLVGKSLDPVAIRAKFNELGVSPERLKVLCQAQNLPPDVCRGDVRGLAIDYSIAQATRGKFMTRVTPYAAGAFNPRTGDYTGQRSTTIADAQAMSAAEAALQKQNYVLIWRYFPKTAMAPQSYTIEDGIARYEKAASELGVDHQAVALLKRNLDDLILLASRSPTVVSSAQAEANLAAARRYLPPGDPAIASLTNTCVRTIGCSLNRSIRVVGRKSSDATSAKSEISSQLITAALLTAPAWGTFLYIRNR